MKMTSNSARLLGRLMRGIKATDEDGIAVLLLLLTEENAQEFFAWCRSLEKAPTWQECFEKAWKIREENGPDSEE